MCKHIIGIWYDYESTDIITLDGLKMRMSDIKSMNEYKKQNNYDKVFGLQKEYTLEDYFNKKKNYESFDLFNYCPYCGEKIELKESGE